MKSLHSGAGQARLTGFILFAVALLMTAVSALPWSTLPAEPTGDDVIAAVAVTAVTVVLFAVGIPLGVIGARRLARQRRVLATGTPVLATLVDIKRTSKENDTEPMSRITLSVPVAGGTVTAVVRQVVPSQLWGLLQYGTRLPVRIDPADPTFAVVDWAHLQPGNDYRGGFVEDAVFLGMDSLL